MVLKKMITIHHNDPKTGKHKFYVYHQAEGEIKGPDQSEVYNPKDLHPDIQKALVQAVNHPVVSELNWQNPDLLDQKLKKAEKNKDIPEVIQGRIIRSQDPSVANRVLDIMGDKLDPGAQYDAIKHKDPSVAHKVIDTFGDKLDSDAQFSAMEHPDPSVKEKAQKLYGGRN